MTDIIGEETLIPLQFGGISSMKVDIVLVSRRKDVGWLSSRSKLNMYFLRTGTQIRSWELPGPVLAVTDTVCRQQRFVIISYSRANSTGSGELMICDISGSRSRRVPMRVRCTKLLDMAQGIVLVGCEDSSLRFLDPCTGALLEKEIPQRRGLGPVTALGESKSIFIGYGSGKVEIRSPADFEEMHKTQDKDAPVQGFFFSGPLVANAYKSSSARIDSKRVWWKKLDKKMLLPKRREENTVLCGDLLLTSKAEGTSGEMVSVKFYDQEFGIPNGHLKKSLRILDWGKCYMFKHTPERKADSKDSLVHFTLFTSTNIVSLRVSKQQTATIEEKLEAIRKEYRSIERRFPEGSGQLAALQGLLMQLESLDTFQLRKDYRDAKSRKERTHVAEEIFVLKGKTTSMVRALEIYSWLGENKVVDEKGRLSGYSKVANMHANRVEAAQRVMQRNFQKYARYEELRKKIIG
eukprot:160419-Amorphochlora_amoeboformis.AAC.1